MSRVVRSYLTLSCINRYPSVDLICTSAWTAIATSMPLGRNFSPRLGTTENTHDQPFWRATSSASLSLCEYEQRLFLAKEDMANNQQAPGDRSTSGLFADRRPLGRAGHCARDCRATAKFFRDGPSYRPVAVRHFARPSGRGACGDRKRNIVADRDRDSRLAGRAVPRCAGGVPSSSGTAAGSSGNSRSIRL